MKIFEISNKINFIQHFRQIFKDYSLEIPVNVSINWAIIIRKYENYRNNYHKIQKINEFNGKIS
jgi:hypothetical protein